MLDLLLYVFYREINGVELPRALLLNTQTGPLIVQSRFQRRAVDERGAKGTNFDPDPFAVGIGSGLIGFEITYKATTRATYICCHSFYL